MKRRLLVILEYRNNSIQKGDDIIKLLFSR